ncbi:translation initiation factor eIF2B subunit delta NDAI_0G01430 [Naumovozyma dairenensis CBS 421]|uniref:Translation initiation factor eIF2B subunit delta n=1 Tax=Naumovozyma dairenensis (strain ATCC 10597 / BCRC 20456 / CBS 421 / NBRC 0211 / NRRL Y-12639) TaxID=1071378 RepID=G0WDQ8_NAUDC|nr:hypothetical protein NDAI_0G01430 [Naumovozyma dairenensis CBS 421]CCD25919.2 hypothetical protein NDAI_0G01430 [Naumovozyma dairenensis CBS 421]
MSESKPRDENLSSNSKGASSPVSPSINSTSTNGSTPASAASAEASEGAKDPTDKVLSNKELKEVEEKEKAAKRAAQKQASGISIEQQQQSAQLKKEKKQQQREKQLREEQKKLEKKNRKLNFKQQQQKLKSTLFGHLETTEERRATILALSSALTSPHASRITATGLMVPMVASAISGSQVYTTSSLANTIINNDNTSSSTNINTSAAATASAVSQMDTALQSSSNIPPTISNANELGKALATITLESDKQTLVPGITSILNQSTFENNPSLVSSIKELLSNKDYIHPAIQLLTSHLANYKIVGSIPRCIAMLEAFQIVIHDYQTPKGTTLSRNLTNYLSHQIDILKKARPLSVTMGNSIRWLKQEISLIDPGMNDSEAKLDLCEKIAQFAKEKIELADQLIIDNASNHIENGATIVTYGSSKVLTEMILHNVLKLKKNIKVIVVDSRPLFEGRKMADKLRENGVNVMYSLVTSLNTIFNMDVDCVFLGAHSILSNGFLYSRTGTAMIAMSANRRNIPVLVCCESLKFSQRVQLDSVTFNELADPNDLITIGYENPVEKRGNKGILLKQFIKERNEMKKHSELDNTTNHKKQQQQQQQGKSDGSKGKSGKNGVSTDNITANDSDITDKNILDGWQELPSLNIVNILYDLTPPEYIKKIITEFGALPPSSVPVILREYKGSA